MSVPHSDPPAPATATTVARRADTRRRRCRVAARTGRSNPSRHGRPSGSAADKAGCTTAPWTLRRSGDGRRPGEAVAVGSIVRWSSAPAQAADDERRTRSGISARREGGVGDGTADLSRETEGGVSARVAHAQAAATLAGDTVTGRAMRGAGSTRDEARVDRPSLTRMTLAQAGDDDAGCCSFDGWSDQTGSPHNIGAAQRDRRHGPGQGRGSILRSLTCPRCTGVRRGRASRSLVKHESDIRRRPSPA
jgi:hypothetical protein